jgi:KUP system potassium uptake protein
MPNTAVIQTDAYRKVGQSLTVAALGVVYGDIGTSPLYAVRQSFGEFR